MSDWRQSLGCILVFYVTLIHGLTATGTSPALDDDNALRIGRMIWKNECAGTIEGLTSWNEGESFASLGIGHFIWYPEGQEGPFDESFPKLVAYLQAHGENIPDWISGPGIDCPWKDRASFMKDLHSPKMKELRSLLERTIAKQARFAAIRMQEALPKIITSASPDLHDRLKARFDRVASHPSGIYALMDYVNFKGEGIKTTERYAGKGWGLLQVLELMQDTAPGAPSVNAFADAAIKALERRVALSPQERKEIRWLPGWKNRIESYRP